MFVEKLQQCYSETQSNLKSSNSIFEQLWQLDEPWFEPPNYRRKGWSGVVKSSFTLDNNVTSVFIKRQRNHQTKTWTHPFTGIPTFQKEYDNIVKLNTKSIPTLEVVYFAVDKRRAILITKELSGYKSLEEIQPSQLTRQEQHELIRDVAKLLQNLHKQRFIHNSLYAKHIFVKKSTHGWKAKLIDLEKLKRGFSSSRALLRDLSTLNRSLGSTWSFRNKIDFVQQYFNEQPLSKKTKQILHKIAKPKKAKRH